MMAKQSHRPMTDREVREILEMRKVIGERLKWRRKRKDPRMGREIRVGIVAPDNPGFDRDLTLYAKAFTSRTGRYKWSVGVLASGLAQNLIRADHHGPHRNPDGVVIDGCMIHVWGVATLDRHAIPGAGLIDCQSADHALISFLDYARIELIGNYQVSFDEGEYGTL